MTPHQTFVEEARELLGQLEQGLGSAHDTESVHAIFRAAHTLKGAAGIFGFDPIVRFAHAAETLLEAIRSGSLALTPEAVELLLQAHDELAALVDAVERGGALQDGSVRVADAMLALVGGHSKSGVRASSATEAPASTQAWQVRVAFGSTVMTDGFDPVSFFRYLERLGIVSQRSCDLSRLPKGAEFNPETCYLTVTAQLDTAAPQATIEKVFEFILDSSQVSVTRVVVQQKEKEETPTPASAAVERPSVKVPADRLDRLIDLVGELVIAGASSSVHTTRLNDAAAGDAMQLLNGLIGAIRDTALGLRMVPIGDTFNRFKRLVRDVSRQLGKDVNLELSGADTELDKAVVERLVDPLTHLVRNSLDHGLETVEARVAAKKPKTGTLWLTARHEGGSILIEVKDDGRGLNRARIFAKAVERGLIAADAKLSPAELDDLIFLPGFSSAEVVTDLSGRGVGMDVVRRTIQELRGSIELQSVEGQGTTLRLRLPLTLAIIDGFVVGAAGDTCILPLKSVVECLDFSSVVESEAHHRLKVRDAPVPFIRLRELFGRSGRQERENVVVVQHGEQRVGLVVDRLMGASQTVIKPLGPLFQKVEGVAGATILGTGHVGFILDVGQVFRLAGARERQRAA